MKASSTTTHPSSWRQLTRAALLLVVGAVVLAIVLATLGIGVVGTHGGGVIQAWDDSVGRWFLHRRDGLVGASKVVAILGDAPVLGGLTVVITITLVALGQRTRAFMPLVAYLGAEFLVTLTRIYVHRPRPATADFPAPGAIPGIHETSASFPSGHATAASAVVVSLAGMAVVTWERWWPWIVGGMLVLSTALSRLVLGVHWFSDVTFGLAIGVAWGVVVIVVLADAPWPFGPDRQGAPPSDVGLPPPPGT